MSTCHTCVSCLRHRLSARVTCVINKVLDHHCTRIYIPKVPEAKSIVTGTTWTEIPALNMHDNVAIQNHLQSLMVWQKNMTMQTANYSGSGNDTPIIEGKLLSL